MLAGVKGRLRLFALDAGFNLIPDYTGEIAFFTTDPKATTPEVYQFQRADQGIAYFFEGVTLRTPGAQELYVLDTATFEAIGYAVFDVR